MRIICKVTIMEKSATGSIGDVYEIISGRQQITFNELSELSSGKGIEPGKLKGALAELERMKVIASRTSGGIPTYYPLQQEGALRKILIVEDDKNINKLMALSVGRGFEISQLYDGGEVVPFVKSNRPDLLILDLMLPHKDGIEICKEIKRDPSISGTIVIIVSAMDPITSRYKGLESGADYYVKKPFDPEDMRSLVTLFLKKKGKRFDPLIDLPDRERITKEIERSIDEGATYSIGTITIGSLGAYVKRFGPDSGMVILRLVSQLIQDIIRAKGGRMFVGFLDSEVFVIAGEKGGVDSAVEELRREFGAVLPFILQDEGYKYSLNIDDLFGSNEVPRLSIIYEESEKIKLRERRNELLRNKGIEPGDIGSYTYDEIMALFGSKDLDVRITRDSGGVRLQVGKGN